MASSRRTLLEPGHADRWVALEDEKRSALRPSDGTQVRELIDQGVALSRIAFEFRQAVRDGRARRRT